MPKPRLLPNATDILTDQSDRIAELERIAREHAQSLIDQAASMNAQIQAILATPPPFKPFMGWTNSNGNNVSLPFNVQKKCLSLDVTLPDNALVSVHAHMTFQLLNGCQAQGWLEWGRTVNVGSGNNHGTGFQNTQTNSIYADISSNASWVGTVGQNWSLGTVSNGDDYTFELWAMNLGGASDTGNPKATVFGDQTTCLVHCLRGDSNTS